MALSITLADDRYFSEETKVMVRSNKEFLISKSRPIEITDHSIVAAHRFNFYRVLSMHGVRPELFWITAFLNDIENPDQSIYGLRRFLSIDISVIDKMIARDLTNQGS